MATHEADAPHPPAHGVYGDDEPHRHERPEDWGWNASPGRLARVGGWLCVVILCLLNVTTYYNDAQSPWLYGTAGVLVLILIRDRYRRKNAWRDQ